MAGRDPYWITARHDGKDARGNPVKAGTRCFYYPNTKALLQGEAAEKAARDFEAARADEAFESGNW